MMLSRCQASGCRTRRLPAAAAVHPKPKPFCIRRPKCTVQQPRCSAVVRDGATGVELPLAQQFWEGDTCRCLGAGPRVKKILIVSVNVYTAALYVEATHAAKELGVRYRGGFFENDEDFCQALLDGAFAKALVIRLVRDVSGDTFAQAVEESLAPRARLTGATVELEQLVAFFRSQALANGSTVVLYWSARANDLEVLVQQPAEDLAATTKSTPQLRLHSSVLCRAMFELYLGSNSIVPQARSAWAGGARALLEYENVRRDSTRPGA